MRRTIQIGDKYKPLMDYYSEKFDKEEFNIFITKLLIAYKKMKDKNIDLITFAELVEPYDIDIIDLIKLISEHASLSEVTPSMDDIMLPEPDSDNKEIVQKAKRIRTRKSQQLDHNESEGDESVNTNTITDNPILRLGIDLSQ